MPAMRLDATELQELAGFFAKRFPNAADRARFCKAAGVDVDATDHGDAIHSWETVLSAAQNASRLATLAAVVAAAAPQDENLQAAARELAPKKAAGIRMPAVALAAGCVLLFGIGLGVAMRVLGDGVVPPAPVTANVSDTREVAAAPTEVSPVAPDAAAERAPVVAEVAPVAPADVEPADAVLATAPVRAPAVPVASSPSAARPPGSPDRARCSGSPGDVVGYWYAGASTPGTQGTTITLTRDARVRADYPHAENRHNARAAERCVLKAGMRVALSQAPIDASRGHWWVPYAIGDAQ